jgi:hypothetical protein
MLLLVGPDPDKVQGCPIDFPDTAFFQTGKVTEILRNDKEGFLISAKFDLRSGISDIRTSFTTIVRERRKETGIELY